MIRSAKCWVQPKPKRSKQNSKQLWCRFSNILANFACYQLFWQIWHVINFFFGKLCRFSTSLSNFACYQLFWQILHVINNCGKFCNFEEKNVAKFVVFIHILYEYMVVQDFGPISEIFQIEILFREQQGQLRRWQVGHCDHNS